MIRAKTPGGWMMDDGMKHRGAYWRYTIERASIRRVGKKGRLVVLVGLVLFLTDDSRMRPCFCLWDCLGTYFSIVREPRESRRYHTYLHYLKSLIIGHC